MLEWTFGFIGCKELKVKDTNMTTVSILSPLRD